MSPPQGSAAAAYAPSVVSGINTSGSYHVYAAPPRAAAAAVLGRQQQQAEARLLSGLPREGVSSSQTPCPSSPPGANVPVAPPTPSSTRHGEASLRRSAAVAKEEPGAVQCPLAPPTPGFGKGVICSPQSPLRSDGHPNSPTESSSSRNASLGLKRPSAGGEDTAAAAAATKARNWKKYRFIVMNQAADGGERGAEGSGGGEFFGTSSSHYQSGPSDTSGEGPAGEAGPDDRGFPVSPMARRAESSCRDSR